MIPAEIFRAYDIRGIFNKTLTIEGIFDIGRAIGSEAISRNCHDICVARDGRLSGPELQASLIKGLCASGCNVIDVGMVPTPVLYFAAEKIGGKTGVMLTGSHNPPEYNGLKIVIGGTTLSGETIQGLRERIVNNDLLSGNGSLREESIDEQYIDRITSDVKLERKLKVVTDCGNGVAGAIAPRLFQELGCDLISLYDEVDGNFPNHHPDPSKPENVQDLIKAVKEHSADVGLAFDGDGDRVGVISPKGDVIWADRIMTLFSQDILSRHPNAQIIYDVKCSRHLGKAIEQAGGQPLMWKTGHSLIKSKMKETGALLAGEMSGHIFFKERWYGFDDGLYSACRLLEILASDAERSTQQIFDALPDSVNTPELNVKMKEGENYAIMKQLIEQADFPGGTINTIDGLRVDFDDGWGLVRPSNTTPVLVLRFEADSDAALERITSDFRTLMLGVNSKLDLPF